MTNVFLTFPISRYISCSYRQSKHLNEPSQSVDEETFLENQAPFSAAGASTIWQLQGLLVSLFNVVILDNIPSVHSPQQFVHE